MSRWKILFARLGLITVALLLAAAVSSVVVPGMTIDGVTLADVLAGTLLFVLTGWLAFWCGLACLGFALTVADRLKWRRLHQTDESTADTPNCMTAILMPVYNEDPEFVFAGLSAMRESLAEAGLTDHFHFYVLSDSTDPDKWIAEEAHLQQLERSSNLPRVFYRHRPKNACRKAGNIADFCQRWGSAYRYMVVLDADSLMEARTLDEMVRRMEADRRLGILQTPPLPLGSGSLLSRSQQFIARLCGPILSVGLAWVSGDGGNYWGHNAIIRIDAFTRYCGLSELPGKKPLGGEILSHDFVEAALMRRAGYKVQLAADLAGSYEQSPTTLTTYTQRDQRWCQGNLQHTRLIVSKNIPVENRFHFLTGVMAYGSSPLLVMFLLLSPLAFLHAGSTSPVSGWVSASLFGLVLLLLFLPRMLSYTLAVTNKRLRTGFGGPILLALSTVAELALSVLMAPIMMTFHSLFVWSTLRDRSVEWNSQDRSSDGLSWGAAWSTHWWQTALGLATLSLSLWLSPMLALWLLPITVGLTLAVPLSVLVSSQKFGERVKRWGLLTVPEERHRPAIVRRFHRYQCLAELQPAGPLEFTDFLRNARAVTEHRHLLESTAAEQIAPAEVERRVRQWLSSPYDYELSREEKWAILSDPDLLEVCHVGAWSHTAPRAKPLAAASV
ncbi:glucans biosynthesis glucosyltransferase MdoH [Aeoliella mucimassa]|uniref:Glucans biosynthesis glucosyltransferase H n=1 Tax=Aeoliella mucimassa TaxID=2527972 RepID=A0A518AJG1_9BACT|nr:glucans biosynthesis glucosyltransferase MdoH [Aeoliella mucimassa]QDU54873.1 Glucans biosynthesis glucosyltransferase H [Aeoliella mucimassa]